MIDDRHTLTHGDVTATVLRHGAELCSFMAGRLEIIWQAGPLWPSHAPILFPIVGEVNGGHLTIEGRRYPMGRHGFARRRDFTWTRRDDAACSLVLEDDAETRAAYPFPFRLTLAYALSEAALNITATAHNPADTLLPCSLGFHPAFNWPLTGSDKAGHRIEMDAPEDDTIAQIDAHGLIAGRIPNPAANGQHLPLTDALFAHDALIFSPVRSGGAHFGAPDGTSVDTTWHGASHLGLWSKPGPFVCIEPWIGHADPAGYAGEFRDKPGIALVPGGGSVALSMSIAVQRPDR